MSMAFMRMMKKSGNPGADMSEENWDGHRLFGLEYADRANVKAEELAGAAVTAPAETVAERIGLLADRCDNLHAAAQLPLPAAQHLPILSASLLELRDELRAIHIEITGDDPWSN